VDVAEGRRQQVAVSAVTGAQRIDGLGEVLIGGVELVVDVGFNAVLSPPTTPISISRMT
jgi:hypothetical protein